MEFNLFIIPATLIAVELLKRIPAINKNLLPIVAVIIGAVLGAAYGLNYSQDLFSHIFYGVVFGAAAAGIYDAAKTAVSSGKSDESDEL